MKKAYLFAYNDRLGPREEVKEYIDTFDLISHWRYDLPNCFYLISESSAEEISERIAKYFGERGMFLVVEIGQNKQGRLLADAWHLVNEKDFTENEWQEIEKR